MSVCGCKDCPWPVCEDCGEDHGSTQYGDKNLCRDCAHDAIFRSIDEHERKNPGSLGKRLSELTALFRGKRRRKR